VQRIDLGVNVRADAYSFKCVVRNWPEEGERILNLYFSSFIRPYASYPAVDVTRYITVLSSLATPAQVRPYDVRRQVIYIYIFTRPYSFVDNRVFGPRILIVRYRRPRECRVRVHYRQFTETGDALANEYTILRAR